MRSWQEMREFSFVGIKLTKAKTISEGLTKCKIQKLTRQNPIYEHHKFHQLIHGRKPCHLCPPRPRPTNHAHSQPALQLRGRTAPLLGQPSPRRKRTARAATSRGAEEGQQEAASREFDRLKGVIGHFGEGMQRTHTQFLRMQDYSRLTTRYFLTEANELTLQLDENRIREDTVGAPKSDRMHLLEQAEAERKRQREVGRQVKALNRPVKFPLQQQQMKAIVHHSQELQSGANSKLSRMMSSLYEYKARANYANKMKAVKQYCK